ncbi:unnamed protein product, partial [Notodromas monacha]
KTGVEVPNKYRIKNSLGNRIYCAEEKSSGFQRAIFGPSRSFKVRICDNYEQEVLSFSRPLRCSCCLFFCCLQLLEARTNAGYRIGTVEQSWSLLRPTFIIKDDMGVAKLKVVGPCGRACFSSSDVTFQIFSMEKPGEKLGKIVERRISNLLEKNRTDADMFGVSFPINLDVKLKAVLIGTDFMYFENRAKKEKNPPVDKRSATTDR